MITQKTIYDFTMKSIDGKDISLGQFRGKKILIVNVASECGYTPQYKDLQKLYEAYKGNLIILGFPANNFGEQEPGSDETIKTFCEKNYGVTFPMFSKISVVGEDQNPLYQWLSKKELNGWNDQAPKWNFCKYLISEKGELLKFFSSAVKPMSEELTGNL
jgi:glutathione peroxidase